MKNLFFIVAILLSGMFYSQNQENPKKELEWTISFKNNKVIFECSKGRNYSYLSFDSYKKVILNENAMANLEKNSDEQNSNFLVQYSKRGNQINLEGIKGVEWKNITLTRDLNSKYYINQTGEIRKIKL